MTEIPLYTDEGQLKGYFSKDSNEVRQERVKQFLQDHHADWYNTHPQDREIVITSLAQLARGIEFIIGSKNLQNFPPIILKQQLDQLPSESGFPDKLYEQTAQALKDHGLAHTNPFFFGRAQRGGFLQEYKELYKTDYLSLKLREEETRKSGRRVSSRMPGVHTRRR